MTLHEAIKKVLQEVGKPLTAKEIADIINGKKLYRRKDGNPVPSSQIHARVKNYPHLFEKSSGFILLTSFQIPVPEEPIDVHEDMSDDTLTSDEIDLLINLSKDEQGLMKYNYLKNALTPAVDLNKVLSVDKLFQELVDSFITLGIKNNPELKVATLVFFFRFVALFKSGEFEKVLSDAEIKYIHECLGEKRNNNYIQIIEELNTSEYLQQIFTPFLISLEPQISFTYELVNELLARYDFSFKAHSIESFGNRYHAFLLKYYVVKEKKRENSWTPSLINKFNVNILDPKPGQTLFDPAVGLGGFFLEINKQHKYSGLDDFHLIGQEIHPEILAICRMNLIMNGIYKAEILEGDSLVNPRIEANSVNIAFTDAPFFNLNKGILQNLKKEVIHNYLLVGNSTSIFLQYMLIALKDSGRMTIIVQNEFLRDEMNLKLRRKLIESDLLEAVITLPREIYSSKSKVRVSILVINKAKEKKKIKKYLFIDAYEAFLLPTPSDDDKYAMSSILADNFKNNSWIYDRGFNELFHMDVGTGIILSESILGKNRYNFSPDRYTNKVLLGLEKLEEKGEEVVILKDIQVKRRNPIIRVTKSKDGSKKIDMPFGNGNHEVMSSLPYTRIRDLSTDFFNCYLNPEILPSFKGIEQSGKYISSNSVLIATQGEKIKPTYYKFQDNPIIINQNILAIHPDEKKVYPEYLIYQLNSELVLKQLEILKRGTTIPFYSKEDILNLKIPLPPYSEQINRVAQYKKQQQEGFRLVRFINNLKLISEVSELKAEIERFIQEYFPNSEQIDFKYELEFDKFPFKEEDISRGNFIKSSADSLIKYLLLINKDNEIIGVVILSEEKDIEYEVYAEINAYANFLITSYISFNQAPINIKLSQFAHTTKNLLPRLKSPINRILNSTNSELISSLKSALVDDQEMIKKRIHSHNMKKDDFIAFNMLKKLSDNLSNYSKFYDKFHKVFMQNDTKSENYNILEQIREILPMLDDPIKFKSENDPINVFVNKTIIEHTLLDLLENALKYSSDKTCELLIDEKQNSVSISIENKIDNIINESIYLKLGKDWILSDTDKPCTGLYFAFQEVNNAGGMIKLADYKQYSLNKKFKVIITLKKA